MPAHNHRSFRMPARGRIPAWLWLIVLILHIPILLLFLDRQHQRQDARWRCGVPGPRSGDSVHAVSLPPLLLQPSVAVERRAVAPQPAQAAAPQTVPTTLPPPERAVAVAPVVSDTPPTRGVMDLRPHYGDGRLWVRPLDESPRAIARTLTGKTDRELTDSAVTSMVQTYLDAMAKEQAANRESLPSWTTKIGGKTVGLDSKWVYLGPIKIPT